MLHEESIHLWVIPGKPTAEIKFPAFIIARGEIEPSFLLHIFHYVSYISILFSLCHGKAHIYSLHGDVYYHQKIVKEFVVNKKGCSNNYNIFQSKQRRQME